jgi:hypothetical protein
LDVNRLFMNCYTAPVGPLVGNAGWWGLSWEEFTIAPDGTFFVDFADFDLLPGMGIMVVYGEPDFDAVRNQFTVPEYGLALPLVVR